MGELFDRIRAAVAEDRYVVSTHADDRLRERMIPAWQAVAGLTDARLIDEWPAATPNPTIRVQQALADGTVVRVVWAYLRYNSAAKLVTIFFEDR